jgi:signal transduction histidine kinase
VTRAIAEVDRAIAECAPAAAGGSPKRGTGERLRDRYRDAERNQFLSALCHDLRDPLAAILMGVGFLLRTLPAEAAVDADPAKGAWTPDSSKRARKMLEAVQRSGERMNRMVRNVADFVRVEGGRLDLDPKAHAAAQIARDAIERMGQPGGGKSIRLELSLEEDERVTCDRERTLTALEQLLGNAVKYSPDASAVVVRVERSNDMIAFSIVDTGPGITGDRLTHIFDRYWHARQTPRDGTGLGLAIAHGIATAQGGTLAVKTAADVGSTFTLKLPRASVSSLPEAPDP